MRNRINRLARKLIVAALISGLTAWLPLPAWRVPSSASAQTANRPSDGLPALQGEQAVAQLKEQGLYDSLQEAVAAARYELRWEDAPARGSLPPAYHAPNPAQKYDAYFTPHGLSLAPRKAAPNGAESAAAPDETAQAEEVPQWRATMRLISYGYGESLLTVGFPELAARGNRIEYRRGWLPVTEWYLNKAAGLEQGFTIEMPPGARSEGERLRLALDVTGDLRAELAEGGQAVALKLANGELALSYRELHATDAQGRELPAQMRVSEGQVILEVDDAQAVYPVTIDPTFIQQAELFDNVGFTGDHFGSSVAIYLDTAVVGSPYDDIDANADQGSACVFVRSNGSWSLQQKLTASDGANGDMFGFSVAISGDTIVVGALGDDIVFNNVTRPEQGSAYVFVRSGTTWSQQGLNQQGLKLIASDGLAGDRFGGSVAISGETVVVGASWHQIGSNRLQGSAYVFVRSGTVWSEQDQMIAGDGAADDLFGCSVAISGDNTVVVGAMGSDIVTNGITKADQGSAYVFVGSNGSWSQRAKLTASDGALTDYFGYSVAINNSGNKIVVGAPYGSGANSANQGSAYVFVRNCSGWFCNLQQKLTANDGADGDWFGRSVAISGNQVLVGAPYDDIVVNGANRANQGSVYEFVCSGSCGAPAKLTAGNGAAGDQFGSSVAIYAGTTSTYLVGAPGRDIGGRHFFTKIDQGTAYVFIR